MAPPLITRAIGDLIRIVDHNDVGSYIETGTYRVNTKALEIDGTEVIDLNENIITTGSIIVTNSSGDGVNITTTSDQNGIYIYNQSNRADGKYALNIIDIDTNARGTVKILNTTGDSLLINNLGTGLDIAFGDGDTGIQETSDDVLTFNVAGSENVTIQTTKVTVNPDIPVYFDGTLGSTYFKYNSSSNRLELWVNGNKKEEWS